MPDYWVLDVEGRAIVVHRAPEPGGYDHVERLADDASVTALAVELTVLVASLL